MEGRRADIHGRDEGSHRGSFSSRKSDWGWVELGVAWAHVHSKVSGSTLNGGLSIMYVRTLCFDHLRDGSVRRSRDAQSGREAGGKDADAVV